MNKEAILFHLREAKEELDRTIHALEADAEYEFENFVVGMGPRENFSVICFG
jgi:hypothetical protein